MEKADFYVIYQLDCLPSNNAILLSHLIGGFDAVSRIGMVWVLNFQGSGSSPALLSGFSGRSGRATGTFENMGVGAVAVGALHSLAPGKMPHSSLKPGGFRLIGLIAASFVEESNIPDSRGEVGRSQHHQLPSLCRKKPTSPGSVSLFEVGSIY
jgi:hypothetical protein